MTHSRILGRCHEKLLAFGPVGALASAIASDRDGRPVARDFTTSVSLTAAVGTAEENACGRGGPLPERLAMEPAGRTGRWRLRWLLLLISMLTLPGAALAQEAEESAAEEGKAFILHLDSLGFGSAGGTPDPGSWSGTNGVSSPTGVGLPNAYGYFDQAGSQADSTIFTPRIQGLQVSMTAEEDPQSIETRRGNAVGRGGNLARPKSIGANYAARTKGFEFSLGGDYGRTPKSVPNAVRLVNDKKLLRVGAHARIREFTLGGAIGSEADPSELGDTLSWDTFARYDFGDLAVGFVYNYTLESGDSAGQGDGMVGTLQVGANYFFTPRMALNMNLAYGNYVNEDERGDAGIAGVLGFSLDF